MDTIIDRDKGTTVHPTRGEVPCYRITITQYKSNKWVNKFFVVAKLSPSEWLLCKDTVEAFEPGVITELLSLHPRLEDAIEQGTSYLNMNQ